MAPKLSCAIGVPNVGTFGGPLLLVELAVAAEEHGWEGFFVWDHQLYWDPDWAVADPVVSKRDQTNPRRADLPPGRRPYAGLRR